MVIWGGGMVVVRAVDSPGTAAMRAKAQTGHSSVPPILIISLHLHEEVNIAYSHPAPIRELESRLFSADFAVSKELTLDSVKPSLTDLIAGLVADGL
jgi:hypothetical protein